MPTVKLKDFDVDKLSDETLEIISDLAKEIKKVSGKSFRFNDPFLLPRIRRRVRRLQDPEITAIYKELKKSLISSVVQTKGAALMSDAERLEKRDFSSLRRRSRKIRKPKISKPRYRPLEASFISVLA